MSFQPSNKVPAENAVLGLLLIVALSSCSRKPVPRTVTEPRALAEYVAAGACFSWFDSEKNFEEIEKRLGDLANNKTEAADQALVMLTGYYLGEHNGEQLFLEIARRGNRMKSLLQKQEQHPAVLKTCAPSLEAENMRATIRGMLDQIDKGVHLD